MDPHQPPPSTPGRPWRDLFRARWDKSPARWIGQGEAWLVFDAGRDVYHCYWFVGPANDHPVERTDAPNAASAVEWARSRTPAARIRLPDHRTYWAGTLPSPAGFTGTWTTTDPSPSAPLPAEQLSPTPSGEPLVHVA